jgi:broad specificity phosphatase PhoE
MRPAAVASLAGETLSDGGRRQLVTRIFLIRHGQTVWNAERRYQGQVESPLTELGMEQFRRVAAALSHEPIRAVYTSPLGRCRWGANRIAELHGLDPVVVPAFAELNHGRLDGIRADDMARHFGDLARQWWTTPSVCRLPGGETLQEAKDRAYPALLKLVDGHPDDTIAIIAHGGINKLLILSLLDAPLDGYWRVAQSNAAVNVIEFARPGRRLFAGPQLLVVNDTSFLKAPSADPTVVGQE